MILRWIGVALLSGSWLLGMNYYTPASAAGWAAAIILGAMLLCVDSLIREHRENSDTLADPQQDQGLSPSPHPNPLPKGEGTERKGPRTNFFPRDQRTIFAYLAIFLLLPVVWLAPWPFRAAPLLLVLGLIIEQFARKVAAADSSGNLENVGATAGLSGSIEGTVGQANSGNHESRSNYPSKKLLHRSLLCSLSGSFNAAGLILFAQIPCLTLYAWWTSRCHDLPSPLPQLLAAAAQLTGVDATSHVSADDSSVVFETVRRTHRLGATWDLLFDPATLCFFAGGLVLLGLFVWQTRPAGRRLKAWIAPAGALCLVIAAWLPIRAALLVAVYVHRVLRGDYSSPLFAMNHFFSPWLLLLLLLGPALLAWRFVRAANHIEPAEASPEVASDAVPSRRFAFAIGLAVLASLLLSLGAYWDPIGQRKGGRVMVVERHSAWEPTLRMYDTEHYGEDPSYNYRLIYDLCAQYYDMSRAIMPDDLADDFDPAIVKDLRDNKKFRQLNDKTLEQCDVLIIKTPCLKDQTKDEEDADKPSPKGKSAEESSAQKALTARYSLEELEAVRRFVERGGGLLLMGDHTNVFNTSTVMNDIIRPMGFTFRNDLLFSLTDSPYDEHYERPPVPHPAIENLPPLDFAVSCSIDPGWTWGRAAIRGQGLFSMGPEYHHSNYHPYPTHVPEMRYGPFIQVWATHYGQGRVLAFTDSTQQSNFCLFQPGKAEVMLGMVEWLNHQGPGDPGPWLLLAGSLLFAGGLWFARKASGAGWLLLLAAGCCVWMLTGATIAAAQRASLPMPKRLPDAAPTTKVVIDRTVSKVPLIRGAFSTAVGAEINRSFGLLEQWIPRLGMPQRYYLTKRDDGEAAFDGDVLVIIYPERPVSAEYRERLVKFVADGGKVLVIDSPANKQSTANELLWPFDLKIIQAEQSWQGILTLGGNWPSLNVDDSREVSGGKPVAFFAERPMAAVASYGSKGGKVMAVGFGSIWNEPNMGGEPLWMVVPDADQKARYEVLYSLMRLLIEDKPVAAAPVGDIPEPDAEIRE
jgi:hypothetical protein